MSRKNKDLPVFRFKRPDAFLYPRFDFLFLQLLNGRFPAIRELSLQAPFFEPNGVIDRTGFVPRPALRLLDPVPCVIHDDPVEPGGKPRFPPEGPDRPVCRKKGVLHDIARLLIVPQHPVGDVEHALLMPLDEDLEGIRIALLAQQDGFHVLVIGHSVQGSNHGIHHLRDFRSPDFPYLRLSCQEKTSRPVPRRTSDAMTPARVSVPLTLRQST